MAPRTELPTTLGALLSLPDQEIIFSGKFQPTVGELKLMASVSGNKTVEEKVLNYCQRLLTDNFLSGEFSSAVSRWNKALAEGFLLKESLEDLQQMTLKTITDSLTFGKSELAKADSQKKFGSNLQEALKFISQLNGL